MHLHRVNFESLTYFSKFRLNEIIRWQLLFIYLLRVNSSNAQPEGILIPSNHDYYDFKRKRKTHTANEFAETKIEIETTGRHDSDIECNLYNYLNIGSHFVWKQKPCAFKWVRVHKTIRLYIIIVNGTYVWCMLYASILRKISCATTCRILNTRLQRERETASETRRRREKKHVFFTLTEVPY